MSIQERSGLGEYFDDMSNTRVAEAMLTVTDNALKNSTGRLKRRVLTEAKNQASTYDGEPGQGQSAPTEVDIYSDDQNIGSGQATTFEFQGDFKNFTTAIPLNPTPGDSSDTTVINLDFDEKVAEEDFYVLSLKFSNGDTYTYFITHP
ncbi:MAG: hypothetical protein U5J98_08025 [Halobacteriales archaeon]|nr:hypothetical protein [Halobacteriales archaeon]